MSARDEVLGRVRRALGSDRADVTVPRAYRRAGDRTLDERVALLTDRLEDYRATVHRAAERELVNLLGDLAPGRVVVPPGFPAAWLTRVDAVADRGLTPTELDGLDGVLTLCAVAVADTGTIVLDGGAGQGRRALSLVPDHHVVIVQPDQVVESVPEAIARLEPRSPQTWISGPSATSDIELQRVEGVHGPRRLDVVLVI